MSVDRHWIWSFDLCPATAARSDYGLPRGWIFIKGRVITHACPACAPAVSRERRGVPVVVADK